MAERKNRDDGQNIQTEIVMLGDIAAVLIVAGVGPQLTGASMDVTDLTVQTMIETIDTHRAADDDEGEGEGRPGDLRDERPELGTGLHGPLDLGAILFLVGGEIGDKQRQHHQVTDDLHADTAHEPVDAFPGRQRPEIAVLVTASRVPVLL